MKKSTWKTSLSFLQWTSMQGSCADTVRSPVLWVLLGRQSAPVYCGNSGTFFPVYVSLAPFYFLAMVLSVLASDPELWVSDVCHDWFLYFLSHLILNNSREDKLYIIYSPWVCVAKCDFATWSSACSRVHSLILLFIYLTDFYSDVIRGRCECQEGVQWWRRTDTILDKKLMISWERDTGNTYLHTLLKTKSWSKLWKISRTAITPVLWLEIGRGRGFLGEWHSDGDLQDRASLYQ